VHIFFVVIQRFFVARQRKIGAIARTAVKVNVKEGLVFLNPTNYFNHIDLWGMITNSGKKSSGFPAYRATFGWGWGRVIACLGRKLMSDGRNN
jgi:hypothetical protein